MGSPPNEPGRFDDETQHQVTLTKPFWICDHEVTQGEWQSVMGWNDSRFTGDPDRPVENVTWFDCAEYCNTRSKSEGLTPAYTISARQLQGQHLAFAFVTWDSTANGYRLPTEAEWEYACRAGSTTAFYNGPITVTDSTHCVEDSTLGVIGWYWQRASRPMPGGCTTWRGMYSSGAGIGSGISGAAR
jgi:formylglycine-generating enzyme required for sulfatase activity